MGATRESLGECSGFPRQLACLAILLALIGVFKVMVRNKYHLIRRDHAGVVTRGSDDSPFLGNPTLRAGHDCVCQEHRSASFDTEDIQIRRDLK